MSVSEYSTTRAELLTARVNDYCACSGLTKGEVIEALSKSIGVLSSDGLLRTDEYVRSVLADVGDTVASSMKFINDFKG